MSIGTRYQAVQQDSNLQKLDMHTTLRGAMVKVLDCNLEVSEFELQLPYYVHFRTNIREKGMNTLIPQAMD